MHLYTLLFLLFSLSCEFAISIRHVRADVLSSVTAATPFDLDWTEADQNYLTLSEADKVKHDYYKEQIKASHLVGECTVCDCIHYLT